MNDSTGHQNVPAGTLNCLDHGGPVTVLRDWDTLIVPACRLDLAGLALLRGILDDAEPGMLAARAEMDAEAAQ